MGITRTESPVEQPLFGFVRIDNKWQQVKVTHAITKPGATCLNRCFSPDGREWETQVTFEYQTPDYVPHPEAPLVLFRDDNGQLYFVDDDGDWLYWDMDGEGVPDEVIQVPGSFDGPNHRGPIDAEGICAAYNEHGVEIDEPWEQIAARSHGL